jgi:hypothetical protein
MKRHIAISVFVLVLLASGMAHAYGDRLEFMFDELGNGWFYGDHWVPVPGILTPDPDPNLGNTLTYTLPIPFYLNAGDIRVWDVAPDPVNGIVGVLSDVLRFEGDKTIRFYSDPAEPLEPPVLAELSQSAWDYLLDPANNALHPNDGGGVVEDNFGRFAWIVSPYQYYYGYSDSPVPPPVPEPSGLLLLGFGLFGLLGFRKRVTE